MNYSKIYKLSFTILVSFLILNVFSVLPGAAADWNSSLSWNSQAAGCQPVSGNIDGVINNVYLGAGSTVPPDIKAQYPQASSGFLEYWKTEMVGMTVNKLKSFVIPAGKGYPSGQLANQPLYFETTILQILNDVNSTGITTRNSVIDVQYSLYTGCQKPTGGFLGGVINNSNQTPLILGSFVVLAILAVGGYVVYAGRNPNLNTKKIMKETKERETKNIQSLKDTLESKTDNDTLNQKKQSSVRRRR